MAHSCSCSPWLGGMRIEVLIPPFSWRGGAARNSPIYHCKLKWDQSQSQQASLMWLHSRWWKSWGWLCDLLTHKGLVRKARAASYCQHCSSICQCYFLFNILYMLFFYISILLIMCIVRWLCCLVFILCTHLCYGPSMCQRISFHSLCWDKTCTLWHLYYV